MGDAAVSALVNQVVGRLASLAVEEFSLIRRLKDDISGLQEDFKNIEAVLQDAEERHFKENEVKLWLKNLRSTSLMVENVLDEVSAEALLQRLHKQRLKYMVRAFFSSDHNKYMSRSRIAHKVKAIRRKVKAIESKRVELGLTPVALSHLDMGVDVEMPDRETSSLIHDSSVIFGRTEEMELISEKICSKDVGKLDNGEIRVYAIWGMGGIGKTTLVQLVYNHERVSEYFELKCWVFVSQRFQVKDIMKGIIESVDKDGCTLTNLDVLQTELQSKLSGKKILIVLDDVWIEADESEKKGWETLRKTLSCGAEGSIILMTTRSKTTSQMFAKVPELQHELGCLSRKDSWLLFEKLAFAQGRVGGDVSELEPIGREIVEKCKGLPLAVKTLGSLMWSKSSASDWKHVKDNDIWVLEEIKVLPAILKLSYDNLLPHLKRCFAYCCLFPKGYEMEMNLLISLWVSNGFIPPREGKDLYVLGKEILRCLVWRSFFQVEDVGTLKMHDLMHDMARDVMKHDCLAIEPTSKKVEVPNEVLHLSSPSSDLHFSQQDLRNLALLRSILILGDVYISDQSELRKYLNHVYLRVLYMTGIQLKRLPESIYRLKLLKYLNLSGSSIKVLPESIIYLQNLEVLLLRSCQNLYKLPKGLRYMRNLLHLDIEGCESLQHLPAGIKYLTNLQKLSTFHVGKEKNRSTIGELADLNLLEGRLEIRQIENVGGLVEAKSANLKSKTKLSELVLRWSSISETEREQEIHEEVLEGLEPNQCLEKWSLYRYQGKSISPTWWVKLNNLVGIVFHECKNCEHLPPLRKLPNLRLIELGYMDSLKGFHDDDINILRDNANMFLSLEKIDIAFCPNLVSLPSNLPKLKNSSLQWCEGLVSLPGNLPVLEKLYLENCKELVSLPGNLPELERLSIYMSNKLASFTSNLPKLKKLILESCEVLVSLPGSLPVLEVLELVNCKELVSLPGNLPVLEVLELVNCKELVSLPGNLPELERLSIYMSNKLTSFTSNLTKLKKLSLESCELLVSLPGSIPVLEVFELVNCKELVSLPGNLPELESLHIYRGDKLTSLTSNLPKLKKLSIHSCEGLNSLPGSLPVLEELELRNCKESVSFPGILPKLKKLILNSCKGLISLPGSLPVLEKLELRNCKESVSFPGILPNIRKLTICHCDGFHSLPDEIRNYKKLTKLEIYSDSQHLRGRCEKETGEDWHKISHIPNIRVYDLDPTFLR